VKCKIQFTWETVNELLAIWKFSNRLCVNLERKLMMGRAIAWSLWHIVTHGQNEHE
jgi:hypothetical protein